MLAKADIDPFCNQTLNGAVWIHSQKFAPGGFLQVSGIHGLETAQRHEIIFVIMSREALHESLIGDMVLAPGALSAETFNGKPGHRVDDVVLRRPASVLRLGGLLDRRLVRGDGKIGPIGFPFRVIVVRLLVPGDEFLGQG
jgi:hypothetical protein